MGHTTQTGRKLLFFFEILSLSLFFLLCWIQTHQSDWYLLLYTEHLAASFFSEVSVLQRLTSPHYTPPPHAPSPFHTDTENTIFSSGGEKTIRPMNGILWLIEISGQWNETFVFQTTLTPSQVQCWAHTFVLGVGIRKATRPSFQMSGLTGWYFEHK